MLLQMFLLKQIIIVKGYSMRASKIIWEILTNLISWGIIDRMHIRLGSLSKDKHLRSRTNFSNTIKIFKSFSFSRVLLDFSTFNQRHIFLLKWRSLLQHRNCNSESSELCEVKGLEFILKPIMKTALSLIPSFLFFVFLAFIHNQREEEN